jgi:hypothetical protein
MRIYDRDMSSATAAGSGRPQETQKTGQDAAGSSSQSGSATGDRVEFSSGLASVSRALSADSASRANKVQQLTAQFQAGTYNPSSLATSQGMVAAAVSSGAK